jgi:hypothetical protein
MTRGIGVHSESYVEDEILVCIGPQGPLLQEAFVVKKRNAFVTS